MWKSLNSQQKFFLKKILKNGSKRNNVFSEEFRRQGSTVLRN